MSARFTIKHSKDADDPQPWKVRDATSPSYLGQHATHDNALIAMENRARRDLGLPPLIAITTAEIRKAMGAKR